MESTEQYLFLSALLSHMKRRHLLNNIFLKILSIVDTVCRAAITTQEMKTFVNFGWCLAIYTIIYVLAY